MLIGVLAGPLGLLLGWAGGALIGGLVDLDRADDVQGALSELSRRMSPGQTGLVAEVNEGSHDAVDALVADTGASILRIPAEQVFDELDKAEAAAEAAAAEARKQLREQKKSEYAEKRHEWIDKIKATLS